MTKSKIDNNKKKYDAMKAGGKKLAKVKNQLRKKIKEGVSAYEIEKLAQKLIKKENAKASFMMVPRYSWATCVNVGRGIVHGIPHKNIVFRSGDIVSLDVGIYYRGYHTDTSFSIGIDIDKKASDFLQVGSRALKQAISKAKPGNRIYDISKEIEEVITKAGLTPIRALVGHGVGRQLHEDPQIPCFAQGEYEKSPKINKGDTYAIEVMYTKGRPAVKIEEDGWTISTRDGKISALFEDTVFVKAKGSEVLTE